MCERELVLRTAKSAQDAATVASTAYPQAEGEPFVWNDCCCCYDLVSKRCCWLLGIYSTLGTQWKNELLYCVKPQRIASGSALAMGRGGTRQWEFWWLARTERERKGALVAGRWKCRKLGRMTQARSGKREKQPQHAKFQQLSGGHTIICLADEPWFGGCVGRVYGSLMSSD